MKSNLSFLLVFFACFSLRAQEIIYSLQSNHEMQGKDRVRRFESDVLDSVIIWTLNPHNLILELIAKKEYHYDVDQYISGYDQLFWTGLEWQNSSKTIYTYDDHHNLLHELRQTWNGVDWENSSQNIFTYDVQDNLLNELQQSWNGVDWVNFSQTFTAYNPNFEKIILLRQEWDSDHWVNSAKDTFIYTTNHQLASATHIFYNEMDGWINFQKYVFEYLDENISLLLFQLWDGSDWTDLSRRQYTYDGHGNNTYYLYQSSISNVWTNAYQYTFNFTPFNEVYLEHGERWENGAWLNYYQYSAVYDKRENLKHDAEHYWTDTWITSDSAIYFYKLASSLEEKTIPGKSFITYPSPAADQVFINVSSNHIEALPYRLYSINGRLLKSAQIEPVKSNAINVSLLAPGSYILQVKIGGLWRTQVFVKQ